MSLNQKSLTPGSSIVFSNLDNPFRNLSDPNMCEANSTNDAFFLLLLPHVRSTFYAQERESVAYKGRFVEKGLLRSYNVDDKDYEHMIQFAWEDWWISDIYSFLSGELAAYNIDAIEDAELLLLTLPQFEEMTLTLPKMERYFSILFKVEFSLLPL